MPIKSILCIFRGEPTELNALSSALALAQAHVSFVRILHIALLPPIYPEAFGATGLAYAGIDSSSTMEMVEASERELTELARRLARDYAGRHGLSFRSEDSDGNSPTDARAVFRRRAGSISSCLPDETRTCDLIVAGYDNSPDGDLSTVLAVLFRAGRPVLCLPHIPGAVLAVDGRPHTIAIAWDGSLAAGRAISQAIPLLVTATRVLILNVLKFGKEAETADDADLVVYLKSHGVVPETVHVFRDREPVGEALLARAKALRADLIVMGAYGHGHIGEMIMGGVTDYLLKHSHMPLFLGR